MFIENQDVTTLLNLYNCLSNNICMLYTSINKTQKSSLKLVLFFFSFFSIDLDSILEKVRQLESTQDELVAKKNKTEAILTDVLSQLNDSKQEIRELKSQNETIVSCDCVSSLQSQTNELSSFKLNTTLTLQDVQRELNELKGIEANSSREMTRSHAFETDIETKLNNLTTFKSTIDLQLNSITSQVMSTNSTLAIYTSQTKELLTYKQSSTKQLSDLEEFQRETKDRLNASLSAYMPASTSYGGHTYRMSDLTITSVAGADSLCRLYGGYLVEIDDKAEFDFLMQFFRTQNETTSNDRLFLGTSKTGTGGDWQQLHSGADFDFTAVGINITISTTFLTSTRKCLSVRNYGTLVGTAYCNSLHDSHLMQEISYIDHYHIRMEQYTVRILCEFDI